MKAKIKSTGEVIEVMQVYEKGESFYVRLDMLDTLEVRYHISELEFEGVETEGKFAETCLNGIKQDIVYSPNYWTKLKHQYAGMAMQGMIKRAYNAYCDDCANYENMIFEDAQALLKDHAEALADVCVEFAHALVEKLKESK